MLLQFLKMRSQSVRNNIKARHENKLTNLRMEAENDRPSAINKKNWVINLSQKTPNRGRTFSSWERS